LNAFTIYLISGIISALLILIPAITSRRSKGGDLKTPLSQLSRHQPVRHIPEVERVEAKPTQTTVAIVEHTITLLVLD